MATRTGRCHCEKVKYEVTGEPIAVSNCYCGTCRSVTGGPYNSVALFPAAQFKLDPSSKPSGYKTSAASTRNFCSNCGANTFNQVDANGNKMTIVTLATLDEGHGLKPGASIFVKSNAPWVTINDGLPQFDEFPPM